MYRASMLLAVLVQGMCVSGVWAGTVNVPKDHPTISEALAAAAPGDTVLVGPGQYSGNLLITKSVHLVARGGSGAESETEIVGTERAAAVILFDSVPGHSTVRGFNINGSALAAAGVEAFESSVDVISNEIHRGSVGVSFRKSQGRIEGNLFYQNGAGELRIFGSSPEVVRNRFDGTGPMAIHIAGKNSVPVIGGAAGQGNVFGPGYSTLISSEMKNDINARFNQWSWSATVEMDSQLYPSNISAIHDGFDDTQLGKVDYRDWITDESEAGSRRTAIYVISAAAALVLVAGVVILRRARARS